MSTMPDDTTLETPETPEAQPADKSDEKPETPEPPEEKGDRDDELPEWARRKLTKANAEAAKYRARLREVEEQLKEAKTPEEFEKAVAEIQARNAELEAALLRERVARKFNLPDDLAARLLGSTVEELEADAKVLQKYAVAPPPGDLRGGLDPSDEEDFDPVEAARWARRFRY